MPAQVNIDDKPRWSRYMIPVAQQSGPKTAATLAIQRQNPGSEFVDVVVDRRDASGNVYHSDVQGYVLLRDGWRDAIGGGGGGSGGRGGGAGQALAAVQANLPAYTGGGQGFQIGAQSTSVLVPPRQNDWKGIDSYNPDNKITGDYSPRAVNFDGFARIGSRCVRRGVAKCTDDIRTVRTSGAAVLNSDYRGLSLVSVPASSGNVGDQIILCYADKDVEIGSAPGGSNQATSYHLCTIGPCWGKTRNMSGMPGPSIGLSDQTGGVLRVTVDYTAFSSAIAGLKKQSITAISIRYNGPYSGATPRYPQDIDGNDGTGSVSLKDRFAWIGTNTSYDTSALTLGKYWVTAWAIGIEGISEPSFASLTLA